MADMPAYIWALVLIGAVGIPSLTAFGLYRSAAAAPGAGRFRPAVIAGGFAAVWAGWIAVSAMLADHGVYRQWIGVAAAGALAFVIGALSIPVVTRGLAGLPGLARLTWPHVVRVVGVVFLLAMALGKLPAVFALLAGLGDISVGLSAPVIARRLARGDRRGAAWFNVLGLADLVIAVTIAFLGGLGLNRLGLTPSTIDLAYLPLALIPSTAVPLAFGLHVVSLARLRTSPAGAVRSDPSRRYPQAQIQH